MTMKEKPVVFQFRGDYYTVGEKVRVSEHYAGYKSQYEFMQGEIYLKGDVPMVRIEINPTDIEQENEIELACWGEIVKV